MLISMQLQPVAPENRRQIVINDRKFVILNLGPLKEPVDEYSYHDGLYHCQKVIDKSFKTVVSLHAFKVHVYRYDLYKRGYVEEKEPRYTNNAFEFILADEDDNLISLLRNGWILQSFATRCLAINGIIAGYRDDWDFTRVYPIITDENCYIQFNPRVELLHWANQGFIKSFELFESISDNFITELKR